MCSFPSKVSSHLRAVSHYLNNRNQQAVSQTQAASSMDQLQNDLVQYQSSGSNPEPPTSNALGQYQPAGNNETPLAGDDLNSDAIVNAQLTHLISRDDAPQGQDASNASDVPMPDAPTVHDIATPRRTVGGRCRKWCISAQPPTPTYIHMVSMGDLVMIMNCSQNKPQIRMQLMQSPANVTPSPEPQRIQKSYSLYQASTAAPPDVERDLFGREEALRMDEVISGLIRFLGTASKIYVVRHMFNLPRGSNLPYSKLNMPSFEPLPTTAHLPLPRKSAWKALILSSWLLLGRPALNASESICAQFLDARLELFLG